MKAWNIDVTSLSKGPNINILTELSLFNALLKPSKIETLNIAVVLTMISRADGSGIFTLFTRSFYISCRNHLYIFDILCSQVLLGLQIIYFFFT